MGDYDLDLVIVVMLVMSLYGFVIRHMCLVFLMFLCCNLLFVHLKVFCLWIWKIFKKILQNYACYACLSIYLCVYCACVIDSF